MSVCVFLCCVLRVGGGGEVLNIYLHQKLLGLSRIRLETEWNGTRNETQANMTEHDRTRGFSNTLRALCAIDNRKKKKTFVN